jgi:hypothetical protein
MYKLNPNYAIIVKQDINNFLTIGFIEYVEEATWLSPIIVVPKKNGKLKICIDFKKLNVATKKDPYPLLFTNEALNTIIGYEAYFFLDGYLRYHQISISFKGWIQNYICYKLKGFYMEIDVVWNLEWTFNIK